MRLVMRRAIVSSERVITPYRLVLSLFSSFATQRVQSLADLQRAFNALWNMRLNYKPFYNRLAKAQFAPFMCALAGRLLERWAVRVLGVEPGAAFSEYERIVIQDGSSFALKKSLAEQYPGRFKRNGPAAVELHATLELFEEAPSRVTLTPDTAPERDELPEAEALKGSLLLADRGYFDRAYLRALDAAGAGFVIRAYTSINPTIVEAFAANGRRVRSLIGKPLKAVHLSKRAPIDLDVQWGQGTSAVRCRLLASWNPEKRQYRYLLTNLARARYSIGQVDGAYRLRWQVELVFKEWKSYANLHGFDTGNPDIAEGLIWTAIAAATLKRFLAHSAQLMKGVEISTRKVAMCAHHVIVNLFETLATARPRRLARAFDAALDYLAANAQRAHPKRDRRSGRSQCIFRPNMNTYSGGT